MRFYSGLLYQKEIKNVKFEILKNWEGIIYTKQKNYTDFFDSHNFLFFQCQQVPKQECTSVPKQVPREECIQVFIDLSNNSELKLDFVLIKL